MEFIEKLQQVGVVAVIRGKSADDAVATCEALLRGGVRGIELTFTTPDCCDAVKRVLENAPEDAAVGVGTVRTTEQMENAAEAGATYAVCPHFDPEVVCAALERGIPVLPGALTPTEIVQVWDSGAAAVKLFPGSAFGPSYVKAVRAPLPDIPLMPTGGVSPSNMAEWFEAGVVAVGMGGNLAKGTPEEIEAAARSTMAELARIRGEG